MATAPDSPSPPPSSSSRVDRLLRWVWLINGLVLLALLVLGGAFLVVGALANLGGGSQSAATSSPPAKHPPRRDEPIRYDAPLPIRGTATRLVLVRHGSGYTYTSVASSEARSGEGAVVNVAFLAQDGSVRLLLDRPAFIRRISFPGHEHGAAADSAAPLRWIVYEMALVDTDRDGAVDDGDRRSLFVSGLDGQSLRQVLPDGFELRDWSPQPDGSLVVTGLQLDAAHPTQMPERAFTVDASGAVRPYVQLDSAAAAAGRIVGAK